MGYTVATDPGASCRDLSWVEYSADGRFLASASHDGTVRLCDPVAGSHIRTSIAPDRA
jgi:WD40 repeat protein